MSRRLAGHAARVGFVAVVLLTQANVAIGAWSSSSQPAVSVSAGTLPAAPGGVDCSWNNATTKKVDWTATGGTVVDGYDIRKASAAAGPFTSVGTASGASAATAAVSDSGPFTYLNVVGKRNNWRGPAGTSINSSACLRTLSTVLGQPPATAATSLSITARAFAFTGTTAYIADSYHKVIWKMNTSTGSTTVFAGNAVAGYSSGVAATSAKIGTVVGLALDSGAANLYFGDNLSIGKINLSTNVLTRITAQGPGFSGDGGPSTSATVNGVRALAFDSAGNLLVVDSANHRVRKIDTSGNISTVAGTGGTGLNGNGGAATVATLWNPQDIAIDASNNYYVSDYSNNVVRRVTAAGVISTYAGTGTSGAGAENVAATASALAGPIGLKLDGSGNLVVSDSSNHRIRKVTTGTGKIDTIAGTTTGYSGDGGAALSAKLNTPYPVGVDPTGRIWIGDFGNLVVRRVTSGTNIISTEAGNGTKGWTGDGGQASTAQVGALRHIALDSSGNLYFADTDSNVVRKISTSGVISTVAGMASPPVGAFSGDGGQATSARLSAPAGVAFNPAGTALYIADTANSRIRKVVLSTGIISTIAGTGSTAAATTGQVATSAPIGNPYSFAVKSDGTIYVTTGSTARVYSFTEGGTVTRVAGSGTSATSGDGGAADGAGLNAPRGIALNAAEDTLYISETLGQVVRKIDLTATPAPTISTYAGTAGVCGNAGDDGPATAATLCGPHQLDTDPAGNLYLANESGHVIRVISPTGIIDTIAGSGSTGYAGGGGLGTASGVAITSPTGLAVDQTTGDVWFSEGASERIRKLSR